MVAHSRPWLSLMSVIQLQKHLTLRCHLDVSISTSVVVGNAISACSWEAIQETIILLWKPTNDPGNQNSGMNSGKSFSVEPHTYLYLLVHFIIYS